MATHPRNFPLMEKTHEVAPKPFLQTCFGRLPPELREKVYIGLLADPPSYAGHDFISCSSILKSSPTIPKRFVHIKASWHQSTRTCRQIYLESHSVFFAAKSYYLKNSHDTELFLAYGRTCFPDYSQRGLSPILRLDSITTLCFGTLITNHKTFSEEQIDKILLDQIHQRRGILNNREQLEADTFKTIDVILCYVLRHLNNLKTVGLCIQVGEEMLYINFLYGLSDLRKGLVEFLDASHWLIRSQNPDDAWRIQYACFTCGDFLRGRDDEEIPYDAMSIERETTDIDSRAPGLKDGDERYIEVQIRRPTVETLPQALPDDDRNNTDWESVPLYSGIDSFSEDSDQDQPEAPYDPVEVYMPAEISDSDISTAELEPEPDSTDSSLLVELQEDAIQDLQYDTDTDQDKDNLSLELASEEVPDTQPRTYSSQTQSSRLSVAYSLETRNAPTEPENSQTSPLDADDEDDQIQTDPKASNQAPEFPNPQPSFGPHAESATEADPMQEKPKEKAEANCRRTGIKDLSSRSKKPLQYILDTPCPYTEEEMESYEEWQQSAITGNQEQTVKAFYREHKPSPPSGRTQGHATKSPCVAYKGTTSEKKGPSSTSPDPSRSQFSCIPIGALCALFLVLVMMSLPPEWLSSARRDTKGQGRQ